MKPILIIILVLSVLSSRAMDRLHALSQIESGDNDNAVGPCGEISRYQILPSIWMQNWPPADSPLRKRFNLNGHTFIGWPTDEYNAHCVLEVIMDNRIGHFVSRYHRQPTDAEYYLLWHCPAHVLHPNTAEADLARRFTNLVQRK